MNGNIIIDPSVGGLYTSSTPVIEGIYVTSPMGILKTGTSSIPSKERLVAKGIFVAGSFLLQRDLGDTNTTTPAELFLRYPGGYRLVSRYNPALLFRMPPDMMEVPYFWQEVAP